MCVYLRRIKKARVEGTKCQYTPRFIKYTLCLFACFVLLFATVEIQAKTEGIKMSLETVMNTSAYITGKKITHHVPPRQVT
jgi:hypothetical protein